MLFSVQDAARPDSKPPTVARRRSGKRLIVFVVILLAACAHQKKPDTQAPVTSVALPSVASTPPVQPRPRTKPPATKTRDAEKETVDDGIDAAQAGYYVDILHGRLRQLADPAMSIGRGNGQITLDVTRHIHFAAGQTQLSPADCSSLQPLAHVLVEYRMTRMSIEVGAEDGSDAATKPARLRAQAIAKCLSDSGVAAKRISVGGVAGKPASSGATTVLLQAMILQK